MLPAWEGVLGFMCFSTSCWERLFTGMVWCKPGHVFPGFCYVFCHLDIAGGLHWRFHSVINKSCFQFICARANCSCLSVPHSGFSRHRERISYALVAFQSGHIYLFMNFKHLTIACSTSFKTLLSVCCVVQFRGTCKCCIGQLLLWWYVSPTKVCTWWILQLEQGTSTVWLEGKQLRNSGCPLQRLMHAFPFHSSCSPKICLVLLACGLQWYKPEWFVGLFQLMPVSALLWGRQGTPEGQAFSSCGPCVTPAFPLDGPSTGSQTWYLTVAFGRLNCPRLKIIWIFELPQGCLDLPFWHPKTCKDSTELQEFIQTKCPFSWGSGLPSPLFNATLRSRIFTTGWFFYCYCKIGLLSTIKRKWFRLTVV